LEVTVGGDYHVKEHTYLTKQTGLIVFFC
jgi:hypothetical protein